MPHDFRAPVCRPLRRVRSTRASRRRARHNAAGGALTGAAFVAFAAWLAWALAQDMKAGPDAPNALARWAADSETVGALYSAAQAHPLAALACGAAFVGLAAWAAVRSGL